MLKHIMFAACSENIWSPCKGSQRANFLANFGGPQYWCARVVRESWYELRVILPERIEDVIGNISSDLMF